MTTRTTYERGRSGTSSGGAAIMRDATDRPDGPGPDIMDAATLKGDNVVNGAGDDLGKIEAIMLDVGAGRIAYAVLSFGGFLGLGNKLFAIPWSTLTLDTNNHRFILDATKEQREAAPGFDKDHWPTMAEQSWAQQIHEFYDARPYWY